MATHSSVLAWEIPWPCSLGGYSPWGHQESDDTAEHTQAATSSRRVLFDSHSVLEKTLE